MLIEFDELMSLGQSEPLHARSQTRDGLFIGECVGGVRTLRRQLALVDSRRGYDTGMMNSELSSEVLTSLLPHEFIYKSF